MIVAEGGHSFLSAVRQVALQWGRNLIVAEGNILEVLETFEADASMGPQLDSCGRAVVCNVATPRSSSFNGAAT